jgi:hypothetical protein
MIAMRKTQQEIEAIIANAKAMAEPYIKIMNEIAAFSTPTAVWENGTFKIINGYETSEVYKLAKNRVEDIFENAQKEINE